MSRTICSVYPRWESCVSTAYRKDGRAKRVIIPYHQAIYEAVLEKEKQPEFKQKLRERMWKMEGLFAEAKSHHGMRRARYRGRWKVQMQVFMISAVQNIKRLMAAGLGDFITAMLDLLGFDPDAVNLQKILIFCPAPA